MGDVSYHIRYFLDYKNFLAMQESKIHTPIWHPPKGNNHNQICSGCYWVINQDMVDHWHWFINTLHKADVWLFRYLSMLFSWSKTTSFSKPQAGRLLATGKWKLLRLVKNEQIEQEKMTDQNMKCIYSFRNMLKNGQSDHATMTQQRNWKPAGKLFASTEKWKQ